jgi:hypothetical protein
MEDGRSRIENRMLSSIFHPPSSIFLIQALSSVHMDFSFLADNTPAMPNTLQAAV